MAGAKHTNRHLQRLMLRGLVLPAAAAGAIVLGASAASADEGTDPVSPASADVQSPVEAAGTTVTSIAEAAEPAEPPTPSPARQPSSGPGSGGSVEQVAEATATLVENGPAESAKRSAAEAHVAGGAAAVLEKDAAPDDQETRPAGTTGATVALEPTPTETHPPEPLPTETLATEAPQPLRTAAQPAEALPTRKSPAEVLATNELAAEATATVDKFTRQVTRPVDRAAAPLSDRLAETTDEATPVFDRLLDEVASAPVTTVAETRVLDVELLETLSEPVREVEAVAGPTLTPVTDAASGLTEQALAPAAATTPIFTGLADSVLADLGDAATGTAGPVLAPLTEPTPIFNRLTSELLAPTLDAAPIPTIALPGFDPASGGAASTSTASPTWQPSASPATTAAPPASAASAWTADWSPAYGVPGSTTGVTTSDARPAPTAVPPLVRSLLTHEPNLIESGLGGGRGFDHSTWPAAFATGSTSVTGSGAGSVDPLPGPVRNLVTELGGLTEALTAAGGGPQGASGSLLLLLMAVLGAALLLRANGLAQLTPGTATALSSRAAQVQDRPG